jgi:hypothetical protein
MKAHNELASLPKNVQASGAYRNRPYMRFWQHATPFVKHGSCHLKLTGFSALCWRISFAAEQQLF